MRRVLNQIQHHLYESSDRRVAANIRNHFKVSANLSVNTFAQREYTPRLEFFLLTCLSVFSHIIKPFYSWQVLSTGSGKKEQVYKSLIKLALNSSRLFNSSAWEINRIKSVLSVLSRNFRQDRFFLLQSNRLLNAQAFLRLHNLLNVASVSRAKGQLPRKATKRLSINFRTTSVYAHC